MDHIDEKKEHFRHRLHRYEDLLKDSYYYKLLADESELEADKQRFKGISDVLYNMFLEEHDNIVKMFKELI